MFCFFFFFQAEDGIRDKLVTGVQTCALPISRDRLLEKFDRQFLARAIAHAGGNLSKAARRAGIDRTTVYRLMDRHGLQRDESGPQRRPSPQSLPSRPDTLQRNKSVAPLRQS